MRVNIEQKQNLQGKKFIHIFILTLFILILSSFQVFASIESFLVYPLTDITVEKNKLFNITTGVRCTSATCDEVIAKLDPQPTENDEVNIEPEVIEELNSNDQVRVIITMKNDEIGEIEEPSLIENPEEKKERKIQELNEIKKKVMINQNELLERVNDEGLTSRLTRIFSARPKNLEVNHRYETVNAISGDLTREGLTALENDPAVESVEIDEVAYATLTQSIPLINADNFWDLSPNGTNLKGAGQTVCVVDTGIDPDHPGFGNRVIAEKCYCSYDGNCCPDNTAEDDAAEDDQGHGTHCAGIVAADYGSYKGVAPEASIVAVKSLNAAGQGYSSEIAAGIDWCVANAATYNITVISLSVGGSTTYSSDCDGASPTYANAISAAVAQDIAVFVASGNAADRSGISAPACVSDAISVGAVYDGNNGGIGWSSCTDPSSSADQVTCFTNSASNLDLLAPGAMTTSLNYAGTVTNKGGTSMACPMVAGAGILLKQFYKDKYNYDITPAEIENKLKLSGKPIDDPFSTRFYPRINLDNIVEKGVIPEYDDWNGYDPFYTINSNPSTDSCLINMTNGQTCNTTWTVNGSQLGSWEFFTIYEEDATQIFTPKFNVTVEKEAPVVTEIYPIDQFFLNPDTINFTYNVSSISDITSCSLVIDGVTINTDNSITKNVEQVFTLNNPSGGDKNWAVRCTDSNGESNTITTENIQITIMTNNEGDSTNLSEVPDIENVSNLIIDNNDYGKINFTESVNLSVGGDINHYVRIRLNSIEIDSTQLPALNKPAILIIKNISYYNPIIIRNGAECADCIIIEEGPDYIKFSVTQFSTYSIGGSSVEFIGTARLADPIVGNFSSQGGNVTNINLSSNISTNRWQGYYGNVTGTLAFGYGSYIFYNFGSAIEYAVYASQNQTFDFYSMQTAAPGDIDTLWNFAAGNDKAVDVFTGAITNISGVLAQSIELNPIGQNFNSTILDDGNIGNKSNFAFGAILNKGGTCFDGTTCDFELIVPVEGLETYYLFLEVG
jgi:subtilisin family serine protease